MTDSPTVIARRVSLLALIFCMGALGCRQTGNKPKVNPEPQRAAADSSAATRGWYYAESKDPANGAVMRVAELHDQWKSSSAQTPAMLKVFHSGKTYAVSIKVPGAQLDDPPLISFRFDHGDPVHEVWLRSDDGDAAFSRSPLTFLKRLSAAQTVAVEYAPANKLPDTVTFYAAGFSSDGFLTNSNAGARSSAHKRAAPHRHRRRGHGHDAAPNAGTDTRAKASPPPSPG